MPRRAVVVPPPSPSCPVCVAAGQMCRRTARDEARATQRAARRAITAARAAIAALKSGGAR